MTHSLHWGRVMCTSVTEQLSANALGHVIKCQPLPQHLTACCTTCMVSSSTALAGKTAQRASARLRSATCRASCSFATVICSHSRNERLHL